jgi:hypothetical protein
LHIEAEFSAQDPIIAFQEVEDIAAVLRKTTDFA